MQHPQHKELQEILLMVDPNGNKKFFAEFSCAGNGAIELQVLDSDHQGVTVQLAPDGTYSVIATGG